MMKIRTKLLVNRSPNRYVNSAASRNPRKVHSVSGCADRRQLSDPSAGLSIARKVLFGS